MSRVLVLSGHAGQLDRRIVAEVNALADSGRDVTLVSVPARIPEACLDQRVKVVVPAGDHHGRTQRLKDLAERYLRPLFNAARTLRYLSAPGPVGKFQTYFRKTTPPQRYDVIHCHDLETLPAALDLRAELCPHAKLIYDSHELFTSRQNNRIIQRYWSRVEAEYVKAADLIITINESISRELARLYGVAKPGVVYNSCEAVRGRSPIDETDFLSHFKATPGGFKAIFQGNLTPHRNLHNLVLAFEQMEQAVQLFLLGSGPLEPSLRRLCRSRRITNVFFGTPVPQEDLLGYVAAADLGVIPYVDAGSLNIRYCTPNKLFEFIEAGVPICASDLPELRAIVRGNAIGDVYEMLTPDDIARAIDDCRTRCVKGEFTEPVFEAARAEFAWEKQRQKLLGLYEQLEV